MAIRTKVRDEETGQEKDGTVVQIVSAKEPFQEIELEDGTVIRIRQTVTEAVRLDEPGPDGGPSYNFSMNATVNVYPPDSAGNP